MSWIDDDGRKIIKNLLTDLKEQGKTVILIEHDEENLIIADRTIFI
jgi:energy-coupling factor transport system ATP-binding protein